MVGREVADLYPRSPRHAGEVVLDLHALAAAGGKPANASLQLRRGEILGIAGLMGAGRTELVRAIFGLDRVVSGSIRIGTLSGTGSPAQRWQNRCGMVSEDRKREGLALNLSIADNMTLPWLKNLGPMGLVFPGQQSAACKPWIDTIPIKCSSAAAKISSLSGGNQQKVAIARLLHANCDVLLLDEPTRGIDVGSKAQIYTLLDQLAKDGKAILMVSSYLPELMGTCDRIAVMSKGRLFPARPVGELTEHDIMVEAIST
jgi:ribose transport system ATP-binding protein